MRIFLSRRGTVSRRLEWTVVGIGFLWIAFHLHPQFLFRYQVTAHGITVRSRAPLPPETTERIDAAFQLVARSELALPGRREDVFLCNSRALFRVLGPASGAAFAFSMPATDKVFIADADVVRNVCRSTAAVYDRRQLFAVMAHEIMHGLIRHALGVIKGILLRSWVAEGYCDYVSGESSFPEAEGLRRLSEGQSDPSASFRYFVARKMVEHLIRDEHYSFGRLVDRAPQFEAVKRETLAALPHE